MPAHLARHRHLPPPSGLAAAALVCATFLACGGGESWQVLRERPRPAEGGPLTVRLVTQPVLDYRSDQGATWVRLKYVVRRQDETPLDPNLFVASLQLDGSPLDPEASAEAAAEMTTMQVVYSLVLDATYSMVAGGEAPFVAMRQAAMASVVEGQRRVEEAGPHTFLWALTWFDDYIYQPLAGWDKEDILRLPMPRLGSFTRLRSAVSHSLADARRLHGAPSAHWHHVMVVFSDGADNHSHVRMPSRQEELTLPGDGPPRRYQVVAGDDRDEARLLEEVGKEDNLTLHTIGMGADDIVQQRQLVALAEAGRGTYQQGSDAASLAQLFARVSHEFASVQTQDVLLPVAAGDYELALSVRAHHDTSAGRVALRLHLGDSDVRVLTAHP